MKRLFVVAIASALTTVAAYAADVHGAWTATSDSPDRVHLTMATGKWMNFGESFDLSDLGLSSSTVQSTTSAPVTLRLQRDAGTLVLEGTFKNGDGAGQFTFTPNTAFFDQLRALDVPIDLQGDRPEGDQLFTLALMNVTIDYVKQMRAIFPDATLRELRKLRGVDVTPEYVRSMRAAGVEVSDAHDAARLRAVDVTPQFVDELARAGYTNLSTRDLVRAAAAGVNGDFIRRFNSKEKRKDKQKE